MSVGKFTWIKTFEQIATWLLKYESDQAYLVAVLKKIGIEGGLLDYDSQQKYEQVKAESDREKQQALILKNTISLSEIDPFTFISLILKNSKYEKLIRILSNLKEEITELHLPSDFKGVPVPNPQGSWFFSYKYGRKQDDIAKLWDLFKAIHGNEEIEEKFNAALDVKQTALASLSQMLFVFFPQQFIPVDKQTKKWFSYHEYFFKQIKWNEYKALISLLQENYKIDFPRLSYTCWFINQQVLSKESAKELLSVRLDKVTTDAGSIQVFRTSQGKPVVLELDHHCSDFNIILEEGVPDELNLNYELRKVVNVDLEKNLPTWVNKVVCVIQTNAEFDWYDFLLILDWLEGSKVLAKQNKGEEQMNGEKAMYEVNQPLNQILSGPPGTGKTYATTELAVRIAVPQWYGLLKVGSEAERRDKIKEKYDELIQNNQIAFTTFHQSFAYEDFIEGLKAYIPDHQNSIAYKVEDGVFKKIAIAAEKSQGISFSSHIGLNDSPTIWKISLGNGWEVERRDRYFKNNEIRIGWNNVGDLSDDQTAQEVETFNALGSNDRSTLICFSSAMKKGDVVLCLKDKKTIQAIGVIDSDYIYEKNDHNSSDPYAHMRKVTWLAIDIDFNILNINKNMTLTQKTVYELSRMSWAKIVEELKNQNITINGVTNTTKKEPEKLNYVLIMDEINRGNISKIFGELITLIEDDKRSGKSDARELVLPYSKTLFSVPSNLYLIGTMNTADKSLTQLDLALRRRFVFREILPNPEGVLQEANQYGFDIVKMLTKINQRIHVLKGKDFQIGHAYFMPLCQPFDHEDKYIETLQDILIRKILPLLQEYFFSHLEYIGLVLNDNSHDDMSKQVVEQININDSIFTFTDKLPKMNPLHSLRLNAECFKSVDRIKQIYA